MKVKRYSNGGTTPKPSWVGKGKAPNDPASVDEMTSAEYLERLTWNEAVKQLEKRGVTMIDKSRKGAEKILQQGNKQMPERNYELAIKKAKEYGVYDQARQDAVRAFRAFQEAEKKNS
jgi:hypothetical protein